MPNPDGTPTALTMRLLLPETRQAALAEVRAAALETRAQLSAMAFRLGVSDRTLRRLVENDADLAGILAAVRQAEQRARIAAGVRAAKTRGIRFAAPRRVRRKDGVPMWGVCADGRLESHCVFRGTKEDAWAQLLTILELETGT